MDKQHPEPFTEQMAVILCLSGEQEVRLAKLDGSYQQRIQEARERLADARRQFRLDAAKMADEDAIRTTFLPVATAEENLAILPVQMLQARGRRECTAPAAA